MKMMLSQSSLSCHLFYPHQHVKAPSFEATRGRLVSSKQQLSTLRFSSQTPSPEVMDGKDCLPNWKTPWLKLCPELDTKTGSVMDSFYSPIDNRVVRLNRRNSLGVPDTAMCFASTGEWLGFVDPQDDCSVYLTNPYFSDKDMSPIRLPSLATLPSVLSVERDPETGLITQYHVIDVTQSRSRDELNIDPSIPYSPNLMATMIRHLALSHSDPRHKDCVVTAMQFEVPRLAYARIWEDPKTSPGWIGLEETNHGGKVQNQVVFSNTTKLFYTITSKGINVFDLISYKKKLSKNVLCFSFSTIRRQLYDHYKNNGELKELKQKCHTIYHLATMETDDCSKSDNGVLLIVRRSLKDPHDTGKHKAPFKTVHFDVFKFKFLERDDKLEHVTSLEDRCIFVGSDQSFTVCASKYPGLQPNCIYFVDCYFSYRAEFTWHNDRGIFSLEDNTIKPISCDYTPEHPLPQCVLHDSVSWKKNEKLFWVSPSNIIDS